MRFSCQLGRRFLFAWVGGLKMTIRSNGRSVQNADITLF
jgi:hypothetical protein